MNDSARTRAVAIVLLAGISLAVYGRGLAAGFVGDDFMILHRLRTLTSPLDVARFFHGEFFEYYRPLPFVSQALDWWAGRYNPVPYHGTNLLLHVLNAILVMLIGFRLSPRSLAGPLAGLLFALHASNHEAVMWISARFDLLATFFSLAALLCLMRDRPATDLAASVLFFAALLSKESAVAMPIAAGAVAVFLQSGSAGRVARAAGPWLAALVLYAILRHVAGGVSAVGGAARLPKAAMLALCLGLLVAGADNRWEHVRRWLISHRGVAAATFAIVLAVSTVAAAAAPNGLMADKLAVAGFGLFHLGSPIAELPGIPFYLEPGTRWYWLGGAIALLAAIAIALALWRRLLDDGRLWFLSAFLLAALLPISALTEGARYLYLPSAALMLIAAILVAESRGLPRVVASLSVAIFIVVSSVQIWTKVADWIWAGRMTADGARLADASLAPSCGGHVVFLTEPVGVRAVYTHFLYETFEPPRGCMPESFQILARVLRLDAHVDVEWDGASRIVLTVPRYQDNIVLSRDLRNFDIPLRGTGAVDVSTPLGRAEAVRLGESERVTLTLRPEVRAARFFYYSDGAIRAAPRDGGH